eukprot:GHVT01023484.1.p1 GENE.GHVT01023484.1~~GHVT01023484.1.p1  ORF type:complete len:147 (-),score=7.40 GHVT01023484.1:1945-2385(-)
MPVGVFGDPRELGRLFCCFTRVFLFQGQIGTINSWAANDIAQELGYAPSKSDLAAFVSAAGSDCTKDVFSAYLGEIEHPEDSLNALRQIFLPNDPTRKGVVSLDIIMSLLCNVGEPLTTHEVAQLLKVCGCASDTNEVKYETLCRR